MATFEALISQHERKVIHAEIIGQLALHIGQSYTGHAINGFVLSHAASGYYIWHFEEWVSVDEIRRFAHMLGGQDFDAYMRGGYTDKAFVAECKRIEEAWEASYPDRTAYDRLVAS